MADSYGAWPIAVEHGRYSSCVLIWQITMEHGYLWRMADSCGTWQIAVEHGRLLHV